MNRSVLLAGLIFLGGCAASNSSLGLMQLETPEYMRDERTLPLNFVQIQRAIFKHQAACTTDIKFAVDPDAPSYARVTKPLTPGATAWNQTIVLGLLLRPTNPTKAHVYSYYSVPKTVITQLYDAILHPEVCS